jgi:dihydroneopterin aldolase
MVTLFVTGLEFYGYHGVPPEERVVGHRYLVDLDLDVKSSAEITDDVADTVDYAAAAQIVIDVAMSNQFKTVERLAFVIAETLLARLSRIERVNIRLAKRLPPAPIIAEELGIELELSRRKPG